jgi:uncharacterized protein YggE
MHMNHRLSFVILFGSLVGCMHPHAIVLSPTAPEGVRVNGVGKASAPPDIARANVGVEVRAATPDEANNAASQRMAAVLAALKQTGIADKDLRTHSYSVSFEQQQTPPADPRAATNAPPSVPHGLYRVTNMVEATLRDLGSVGKVLKAANDAGANNVWGVKFEIEDDSALLSRARALAVKDAQRAANELAQLSGVKLGEVVSVTEGEPNLDEAGPQPYALRATAADVPIEHGEIVVNYVVQLVYATQRD